jgi:hypothetical protein
MRDMPFTQVRIPVRKYLSFVVVVVVLFSSCLIVGQINSLNSPTALILEIDADRDEHLQIFWKKRNQGYSQDRSARALIKPSQTSYRFILPGYGGYDTIRIDPFERPAEIVLRSLYYGNGDRPFLEVSGGDDLLKFVVPEPGSCVIQKARDGLIISSAGNDSRLVLKTKSPLLFLSGYRTTLVLASLFSVIAAGLLFYLLSNSYRQNSFSHYPKNLRQWGAWGSGIFLGAIYLLYTFPAILPEEATKTAYPAWLIIFSVWLFIPTFYFVTRPESSWRSPLPTRLSWLGYALPICVVFGFHLLAFWPASMSPDSLDQWDQIVTFDFKDWHPTFHSLTLWLVTRIWESPSMAGIFQIVLLASSFGWALARLQVYGVPRTILFCSGLFFALTPVNGLMAITIWKDIPYSAAMLVFAVCLLEIALTSGRWLSTKKNIIFLALVILLVSLYRHNGIFPAFMTPLILFLLYPRQWKSVTIIVLISASLHVMIRGPLYDKLDVSRGTPLDHVIAQIETRLSTWVDGNEPEAADSRVIIRPGAVSDKGSLSHELEAPSTGMPEVLQSSSLLWQIKPLEGYYKRVDYVNLWGQQKEQLRIRYISGNDLGLSENPQIETITEMLYRLFEQSKHHVALFWMWRPAVYLYLLVGAALIATLRHRKMLMLPLVPLVLNSAPTLFFIIHKSIFRYHYAIVLTAFLLILPYLFVTPDCSDNSTKSGRS